MSPFIAKGADPSSNYISHCICGSGLCLLPDSEFSAQKAAEELQRRFRLTDTPGDLTRLHDRAYRLHKLHPDSQASLWLLHVPPHSLTPTTGHTAVLLPLQSHSSLLLSCYQLTHRADCSGSEPGQVQATRSPRREGSAEQTRIPAEKSDRTREPGGAETARVVAG